MLGAQYGESEPEQDEHIHVIRRNSGFLIKYENIMKMVAIRFLFDGGVTNVERRKRE